MPVKKVFRDFQEDTPELLEQIGAHDWEFMIVNQIVKNNEQLKRIKKEMFCNIKMLQEIYVYLHSRSISYPHLDINDMNKFFFEYLGFKSTGNLLRATIHNILLETCVQGERSRGTHNGQTTG